jgi:hypothetical protein
MRTYACMRVRDLHRKSKHEKKKHGKNCREHTKLIFRTININLNVILFYCVTYEIIYSRYTLQVDSAMQCLIEIYRVQIPACNSDKQKFRRTLCS